MILGSSTAQGAASSACLKDSGACKICINEGGYCVAYLQSKGFKYRGNAKDWCNAAGNKKYTLGPGKTSPDAGDAVVFNIAPVGHVAYIETVNVSNKNMTITEYNWGASMVNKSCSITNKFKEKATRLVTYNASNILCFVKK
jgi:surface antigen